MGAIELKRVAAPFKEKENCDKPQSDNVAICTCSEVGLSKNWNANVLCCKL